MIQGMEQLPCENGLRELGAVQPREEKALGRPTSGLSVVPKGELYKRRDLLTRISCDKMRGDGSKIKSGDLDWI